MPRYRISERRVEYQTWEIDAPDHETATEHYTEGEPLSNGHTYGDIEVENVEVQMPDGTWEPSRLPNEPTTGLEAGRD